MLQQVFEAAQDAGLPVTFSLATGNSGDPIWPDAITMIEKFNAAGGAITAQMFPRPIGLVIGLELTGNPFVLYPSYQEIAHLPLAERVAEMRKPEVRERILADKPGTDGHPLLYLAQAWDWIFPLGDDPDYEPAASTSIAARARARGVSPKEEAYDRLLDEDGRRDAAGGDGQLPEQLARHRRGTVAARRHRARARRRWRALRDDLRRELPPRSCWPTGPATGRRGG